ncbi:unnamed protein product [Oppiella nova]|uniref:Uncharacterized protein n=1 Tax=Oppiella nova TaxID=334625 RepID=A0A7R9R0Q5_9ACAR|nr:unnamed protein product [Oppiella nova]CAG2182727.1 unnamed protein product [Oppiella nova]
MSRLTTQSRAPEPATAQYPSVPDCTCGPVGMATGKPGTIRSAVRTCGIWRPISRRRPRECSWLGRPPIRWRSVGELFRRPTTICCRFRSTTSLPINSKPNRRPPALTRRAFLWPKLRSQSRLPSLHSHHPKVFRTQRRVHPLSYPTARQ